MASIYKNDKNFLIIEMDRTEASSLNFGIQVPGELNTILCGSCNNSIDDKIYYMCCLGEVYCKDCIDDMINNLNHYIDDDSLRYEVNHFNIIANKLNIKKQVEFTADSIFKFIDVE